MLRIRRRFTRRSRSTAQRLLLASVLALLAACGDPTGGRPVPDITGMTIYDGAGEVLASSVCLLSCIITGTIPVLQTGQPYPVAVQLEERSGASIDDEIRLQFSDPAVTWTGGGQSANRREGTITCSHATTSLVTVTVGLFRKGKRIWWVDSFSLHCS